MFSMDSNFVIKKKGMGRVSEAGCMSDLQTPHTYCLQTQFPGDVSNEKETLEERHFPIASIGAITSFGTWFHVTRWPTGWTKNRSSRYK